MSHNNNFCAPGRENNATGSCFNETELKQIAGKYNQKNNDQINTSQSPKKIHSEIKQKLNPLSCKDDYCLIDNQIVKEAVENLEDKFRPQRNEKWDKENPKQWLNTNEIDNVLKQYEQKYKDFEFIGPTPLDFDAIINEQDSADQQQCVLNDLCKFNIETFLQKGKTKIGIVFNTDDHTGSGKHWISSFIDFESGQINFFDSATSIANPSTNSESEDIRELKEGESFLEKYKNISDLLHKIKKQGNQLVQERKYPNIQTPFSIYYNTRKHQQEDSECGMYSMYFIIQMLAGNSFKKINQTRIADDDVFKYRYILFHPNKQTKQPPQQQPPQLSASVQINELTNNDKVYDFLDQSKKKHRKHRNNRKYRNRRNNRKHRNNRNIDDEKYYYLIHPTKKINNQNMKISVFNKEGRKMLKQYLLTLLNYEKNK